MQLQKTPTPIMLWTEFFAGNYLPVKIARLEIIFKQRQLQLLQMITSTHFLHIMPKPWKLNLKFSLN